VALGQLLLRITFFQLFDAYLLPLLPFALIVVSRRTGDWLDRLAWPTGAQALALMVVGALSVRGMQSSAQAIWAGSDRLLAQGVPAEQISSSWEWASYNGRI